ncbi:hypothetical protein GCM10009569_35070 [Arthrobacter russicus]|uniref:Uncharacterized protein n=1 Tax=Arthrobacter russicus TaxID=172040 RepID=A0ABU1J906_9MICC|nr:hypothetical protein [Arthrobacter russicus]
MTKTSSVSQDTLQLIHYGYVQKVDQAQGGRYILTASHRANFGDFDTAIHENLATLADEPGRNISLVILTNKGRKALAS